MGKRSMRWLN